MIIADHDGKEPVDFPFVDFNSILSSSFIIREYSPFWTIIGILNVYALVPEELWSWYYSVNQYQENG